MSIAARIFETSSDEEGPGLEAGMPRSRVGMHLGFALAAS